MECNDIIAEYTGSGILVIGEEQNVPCEFKATQSYGGSITLVCDIRPDSIPFGNCPCNAKEFHGETSEGWKITTDGELIGTQFRFESDSEYSQLELGVKCLNVLISANEKPDRICFGLTNLKFFGTEIEEIKTPTGVSRRRSSMKLNLLGEEVWIKQAANYKEIIDYIDSSKDSRVTSELSILLSGDDLEKKKKVAEDLCYLTSIMCGTKIVWIYYNLYYQDKIISRVHLHGITKRYNGGLPLLMDNWDAGNAVKLFLESTYSTYQARRDKYRLNHGIIDAYLDAKAEGDYLETRGSKLALAMEKLKAMFIDTQESREYIIDKDKFKDYRTDIKQLLSGYFKCRNIEKEQRGKLYENISCINRTSFKDLLCKLCNEIDLPIDDEDMCLFINSRNTLIHQGIFYCKNKEIDPNCPPLPSIIEEYFFIVNILDKTMLRLVGYHGQYINCRGFSKEGLQIETI